MARANEKTTRVDAPAQLALSLLGPARLAYAEQPHTFAYDKVLALLAFLAVEHDRAHRRSALADLLWPEHEEAVARRNLSQALYTLRQSLPDDPDVPLLLATRDTVQLNPLHALWVDVAAFRGLVAEAGENIAQLQQASALYRGEFLEGFRIDDSASFEEWVLLTRAKLHAQYCGVLQTLSDPQHGVADAARRCDYARRWVALEPLDEAAHRQLMRALAANGQRTAALAQFAQCRRILHDELGIAPEAATVALSEELRQRESPAQPQPAPSPRAALPLPPTRLVARARELGELTALLADPTTRLLTITGPGGVGKTRLALHAATAQAAAFRDGVYFVPLAPVRDPALVWAAIAQALAVRQQDARPLAELVGAALANRHTLLVLDNCEHLLPAVATLVAELLSLAPGLVVLATSRVTLRLSLELRYQLAPLSLEQGLGHEATPTAPSAAAALFVERAQAVRGSVELDYDAIEAICRRLDGLPLAIELAATRVRLLTPRALLQRLEPRLPLLSGGPRDLPERQQTLTATIDWSYQLLEPDQQALFRRLAVFAGSWTVAAAEAVCADVTDTTQAASVLDGLAALLDASLITELAGADEPRCTMLETVREYAHEQLVAHGEAAYVEERHAHYGVALAGQAAAELLGPAQGAWLRQLDAELDNLRAALGWCGAHAVGAGLRLASDVFRFWEVRGYWREGRAWLETLLEQPADPGDPAPTHAERAMGLLSAGMLAHQLSDFASAVTHLQASMELYQQLDDQHNIARILNNLGNILIKQGDYRQAEQYYRESLALRRALNYTQGMASSLHNLAVATRLLGDLDAAKAYHGQSLVLYQQLGDRVNAASVMGHMADILRLQGAYNEAEQLFSASHAIAHEFGDKRGVRHTLNGLGRVAHKQQRYDAAKAYYRQSLTIAVELHHVSAVSHGIFCFAAIASAEERVERAAVLLSAAAALEHRAQTPLDPEDAAEFEQHVANIRAALDAAAFEAAWARGQRLSLEQAVALALDDAP